MIAELAQSLPPGLVLVLGALLVPWLRGGLRQAFMLGLPALGLLQLWLLPDGFQMSVPLFGLDLQLVRVDPLSRCFGIVFHVAAALGIVYAMHLRDSLQSVAALVYAGSAIAAVFAGDLLSLFVTWELTAVSSVLLIWARRSPASFRSGLRYLVIQVASGVLLLAGTVLHYVDTGSLAFDRLGLVSVATGFIFVGFGIKAAFPLLHNWLEDSYPEATVTGAVFLSGFTTKLAIYALARGFAGTEILIPIGAVMTAFPIFYAVIENDLRRVLAYSINNQLGFMVVGIGIGTELALNGAVAHAFAEVIFKALLFMAMGAVMLRTGTVKGSELGGLAKSMPWTTLFCVVGAASIAGFPLTSGFVSKSMILAAAGEEQRVIVFLVLLFASAGVFHHAGIKIPFFAFFAHDRGWRVKEAPANMLVAMASSSLLCLGIGIFPGLFYLLLPYPTHYQPYTTTHVVTSTQLLLFSALAFTVLMRTGLYPPELRSTLLDSDWIYRRALPRLGGALARRYSRVQSALCERTDRLRGRVLGALAEGHRPGGFLREPASSGVAAMWAVILIVAYLLLEY